MCVYLCVCVFVYVLGCGRCGWVISLSVYALIWNCGWVESGLLSSPWVDSPGRLPCHVIGNAAYLFCRLHWGRGSILPSVTSRAPADGLCLVTCHVQMTVCCQWGNYKCSKGSHPVALIAVSTFPTDCLSSFVWAARPPLVLLREFRESPFLSMSLHMTNRKLLAVKRLADWFVCRLSGSF